MIHSSSDWARQPSPRVSIRIPPRPELEGKDLFLFVRVDTIYPVAAGKGAFAEEYEALAGGFRIGIASPEDRRAYDEWREEYRRWRSHRERLLTLAPWILGPPIFLLGLAFVGLLTLGIPYLVWRLTKAIPGLSKRLQRTAGAAR